MFTLRCIVMYSNELPAYRNKQTNNKNKQTWHGQWLRLKIQDKVQCSTTGRSANVDASYLYNIQFIWSGLSRMGDIIERRIFLLNI